MIIGVTDEAPSLLDKWVADKKPTYPIVSLKSGEFEQFLQVKGFPTAAVIDPDGTVSFAGSAGMTAGPLGDAMSKAKKGPLWPKCLDKVTKHLSKGAVDKGYAELVKLIEGGKVSEEDQTAVDLFKTYLESKAADALAKAVEFKERGFVYLAVTEVDVYAKSKTAFPASAEAAKLIEELSALPDFKKEMKGGEALAEFQALADDQEYLEAAKGYRDVYKKYKGTRISELAKAAAQVLIQDGMVGYKATCPTCRAAKKACQKHHEDLKL